MAERKIYTGFGFESATPETIKQTEENTGLQFPILLLYKAWQYGDIDKAFLDQASRVQKTPLITWEPWDPSQGIDQPDYRLAKIAEGTHDAYIKRNAQNLKDHEQPLFLRFAHEMNGDWYPWGGTVNGNQPEDYARAWNRVHDIFTDTGANNVTFVWSPDAGGSEQDPGISSYIPSDEKFDWAGFSGYNWGQSQSWSSWKPLTAIIDDVYPELTCLTDKPIMIAETGSTELGGNKANWIKKGLRQLPLFEQIDALVWFNLDKEGHTDWRVETSETSLQAFKDAAAHEIFDAKTVATQNGKIVPIR